MAESVSEQSLNSLVTRSNARSTSGFPSSAETKSPPHLQFHKNTITLGPTLFDFSLVSFIPDRPVLSLSFQIPPSFHDSPLFRSVATSRTAAVLIGSPVSPLYNKIQLDPLQPEFPLRYNSPSNHQSRNKTPKVSPSQSRSRTASDRHD